MTNQGEGLMWYLDKTKEDDDPGSKETEGESPCWRSELRGVDTDQLALRRFRHLAGDDVDLFGDGGDDNDNLVVGAWKWWGQQAPYKTPPEEHFASRTGQNWRREVRLGCQRAWQTIKIKEPVESATECENHLDWSSVIEDWLKRSAFFGWYFFGKDQQVKRRNHLPAATLAATPSPASQKVVFV